MGNRKCNVCGNPCVEAQEAEMDVLYCKCKNCGEYFLSVSGARWFQEDGNAILNRQKLVHFLFYNKKVGKRFVIGSKSDFSSKIKQNPNNIFVIPQMVENWYPKNFARKIDLILLKLGSLSTYEGEYIDICLYSKSLFFVPIFNNMSSSTEENFLARIHLSMNLYQEPREVENRQLEFIFQYLTNNGYTSKFNNSLQLTPKAWERIYELQKTQALNKNVFIAMKFGLETEELRKKIKESIQEAGYEPVIMDEVEHNHQIVPEMLYQIRNSKFVIAELSHHNNGAYYEAGYALGLGKEVIHICKESELKNGLHFDVAQVNTIVYETIDDLPDKIVKRIKATIG